MNFFQLLPIEQWHSTWYTSYEISCWWKLLNKFQVSEKDFLSKAAPILCFQIFLGFYIWEIEKNRKDRERTFEICGFCELQRLPLLLSKFPQSQWRFFFFIWNPEKIQKYKDFFSNAVLLSIFYFVKLYFEQAWIILWEKVFPPLHVSSEMA